MIGRQGLDADIDPRCRQAPFVDQENGLNALATPIASLPDLLKSGK